MAHILNGIPDFVKESAIVAVLVNPRLWEFVNLYISDYWQFLGLGLGPVPNTIIKTLAEISRLGVWQRYLAKDLVKRIKNRHH